VIKTAVSTLKSAGVSTVVVVTGNNAEQLTKHLSKLDVDYVYNENYARTDMFYSACMGLSYIKDKTDRVFFLPVDVPLFSRQSLFMMMGYMDCCNCSILIPTHNGKRGHTLLINNNAIHQLLDYQGTKGLRGAVEGYAGSKGTIELADIGITIDADKPEHYELLQQYAKSIALSEPITCSTRISLQRKDIFFDNNIAGLLQQVAQTSSLSEACLSMGVSYSSGWRMIKIAESQLGFPLLYSRAGGACGGGSNLTKEGLELLENFRRLQQEVDQFCELNFHKLFSKYQK
jgi:molybdate transport repressor ModE-like protein